MIGGGAYINLPYARGAVWDFSAAALAASYRPIVLAAGGLGAGATVSPGLWLAGFSLPAQMVGRAFALVELVRSEADFIMAPVLLQVAQLSSGGWNLRAEGLRNAIWVRLLITIAGTVSWPAVSACRRPDWPRWLTANRVAIKSPALGAALRRSHK